MKWVNGMWRPKKIIQCFVRCCIKCTVTDAHHSAVVVETTAWKTGNHGQCRAGTSGRSLCTIMKTQINIYIHDRHSPRNWMGHVHCEWITFNGHSVIRNRKSIARTRYIIQFLVLPDGNKACWSSRTGLVRLLCGGLWIQRNCICYKCYQCKGNSQIPIFWLCNSATHATLCDSCNSVRLST